MTPRTSESMPPEDTPEIDAGLLDRARHGDMTAFDELVRRYHGKLFGLIYNMTSNREDAEDLVQDVFVRAYNALGRFRGQSSFYTWLYRIAINRTLNFLARRRRRATAISLAPLDEAVERDPVFVEVSGRQTPEREAFLTELRNKLNIALQSLSDKHRAVVTLHDIQGVPHDEIARILRCSPGTVRSRLFYARKRLQQELAGYLS